MASVQATGRPMYYWTGTDWIPIASVIGDTEVIQDVAADMFDHLDHSNITVSYDDANNKIVLSALGNVLSVNGASGNVVLSTDDINEGTTNLYFTDGRAITSTASAIATASAQALYQANLYTDSVLPNASAAAVSAIRWKYKGTYNNGLDYAPDDVVTYDTSLWIRIGEPNPGYPPYVGSPYWQLLAISEVDLTDYLTTASAAAIYHTTASATASVAYLEELIDQLQLSIGPSSASATASRITAYVKNGTTPLAIGTPVYITGSDGTNIIVGPASNASESTSSKTFGFTQTALNANQHGYIVLQGELKGLDTSSGNQGDAIWLGNTPGTVIYGLANKPSAPNHLVFLGVVSRKNANNGEIFVSIQNGFELDELHDVKINGIANGDIIKWNSASSLWINTPLITTNVPEGDNLYFTNERVNAAATGLFVHANHTNLTAQFLNNQIVLSASGGGGGGGASLLVSASAPLSPTEGDGWFESDTGTFYVFDGTYWVEVSTNVSINAESAQDAIAPLLNHGFHENITATYNDASNKIILSASAGGGVGNVISVNGQEGVIVLTTSNIAEGTNRYFTNQRAIDAASAVYLSDATASTKYLEQTNAASTYVTQSNANTLYAPKNSPVFTGVPQAPTAGTSTNTTQIATTAYVKNQAYLTTANASSTYLTQINADNVYQTKADGITGVNASAAFYAKTGGPISGNMSVSGSANVTGNVTIGGNLTVSGSSTIINAETIQLADNTIVLNSNVTGVPTENAGIEIERGDLSNVSIRWNESNDYWEYTTDGTIYRALGGGAVQYAPGDPSFTDPNILTGTVWVESDVTGSAINVNDYLTKVDASATYLTQVGASSTYVDFTDTRLVKYGSTQPSSPDTGTVWIDSTNITSPITKVYNGTTWIIASGADAGLHPFFTAGI
jgi:hypothetical protein